jgi:hypothetical protein
VRRKKKTQPPLSWEQLERRFCPAAVSIAGGREVTEGDTSPVVFTVTLSEPLAAPASVSYSLVGSTARLNSDFRMTPRAASGRITFAPGETSKQITVSVTDDAARESTEWLRVSLQRPQNCVLGNAVSTATIRDNDSYTATVTPVSGTVTEGSPANFTVALSSPATKDERFTVSMANGSARAGSDFASRRPFGVVIPRGAASTTFSVATFPDAAAESAESFHVSVKPSTRGMPTPGRATVLIQDPAPPPPPVIPSVRVDDVSITEGNSGASTAQFLITLSTPTTSAVTVNYWTASGTALGGIDFSVASGILTFSPGETSKVVAVPVTGDLVFEPSEVFSLNLSSPVNATIAKSSATATILNDDTAVTPSVGIANASINEGNSGSKLANFAVALSTSSSQTVTVSYNTATGTATDNDFTAASGTLTFSPGQTSKTIAVPVIGDKEFEANETFRVLLTGVSGATLGTSEGTGTILNDDAAPLPGLSMANASVLEGNSGTTAASFILSLSFANSSPVTVSYATANGTATTADGDYSSQSGTVTFSPGELQKVITVSIVGDNKPENDETFAVNLFSPLNATLLRAQATGTIRNDDAAPTLGSWTVMVYMTGDDLNGDAFNDINEMEWALNSLPGSVNIVVSWDQPANSGPFPAWSTANGSQQAWRSYGRSKLTADPNSTQDDWSPSNPNPVGNRIVSSFELFPQDKNTGDPAVLSDFLRWGAQQAPAERYLLMMWGHGGGLLGSNKDHESWSDELSISEMATALSAPGVPTFEIVGYDNCFMGMAEVAYAIAPYVPGFFVGSEEIVPPYGHDYTTVFNSLQSNPRAVSSETVARGIVTSFETQRAQKLQDPTWVNLAWKSTYSAIRTSAMGLLASSLRAFVAGSANLTAQDWTDLRYWTQRVHTYGGKKFADLGQFLFYVANEPLLPSNFRTSAALAFNALDNAVVQRSADPFNSTGLAIYLRADGYFDYRYVDDAPEFISATNWAEFIYWLSYPAIPN